MNETNNLKAILQALGVSYAEVQNLCHERAVVSSRTVSDIANGKKKGNLKSRMRIVNALNRFEGRQKEYSHKDIFGYDEQ